MKKILAIVLCLTFSTPCFAYGGPHHHNRYHHQMPLHRPHIHTVVHHHNPPVVHHYGHRASVTTKTLGAVAGIAGVAFLISAIAD